MTSLLESWRELSHFEYATAITMGYKVEVPPTQAQPICCQFSELSLCQLLDEGIHEKWGAEGQRSRVRESAGHPRRKFANSGMCGA